MVACSAGRDAGDDGAEGERDGGDGRACGGAGARHQHSEPRSHDSGDLDGEVISGPFAGRALQSLSESELLEVLRDSRERDPQSAALLEAYLDRTRGDSWRDSDTDDAGSHSARPSPPDGMSVNQAAEILGVPAEASDEEITAAHRRLIQKLHTDRGGTDYLAALTNEARDALLSGR